MSIPKYFVQTSKQKPQQYIVDMIQEKIPGWTYEHYDDEEAINFFKKHPIKELPDVINKFNSMSFGEHKADLFRYYYLFINGGVYMDSDAMLLINIDDIVKDYTFFSVNSSYFQNTIFQGFIGCTPRNRIIEKALIDIYNTPNQIMNHYFNIFCINLYSFYINEENQIKHLYQEKTGNPLYAPVFDMQNNVEILRHYYADKIIPKLIS